DVRALDGADVRRVGRGARRTVGGGRAHDAQRCPPGHGRRRRRDVGRGGAPGHDPARAGTPAGSWSGRGLSSVPGPGDDDEVTMTDANQLLDGVRIVEVSMLGPAAITTALADLGAEVIKVEPPQGDYVRDMTWPIVEGVSLMHLHVNRGKRSVVLDLRKPEAVEVYLDLVRGADAVGEAMRPGGLERRGLGYEKLREVNPKIVFITISGYGMTGPYADLASHGIAYDTWAGVVPMSNAIDEEGFYYIPEHASIGIHTGPLFGALGVLAG